MSVLKFRHTVEAPPERRRAVPASALPPLEPNTPARSVAVLKDLRAADRTLGMRAPAAPDEPKWMPDWQRDAIFGLMRLDVRKARVYTSRYDVVAGEIEAALAELAALAPLTAKVGASR